MRSDKDFVRLGRAGASTGVGAAGATTTTAAVTTTTTKAAPCWFDKFQPGHSVVEAEFRYHLWLPV